MAKHIIKAKRSTYTHHGITLTLVDATHDLMPSWISGRLRSVSDDNKDVQFEQLSDTLRVLGDRKWITKHENRRLRIRVNKHKDTGEWRIMKTFTLDEVRKLNLRRLSEIEGALADGLTYILQMQKP